MSNKNKVVKKEIDVVEFNRTKQLYESSREPLKELAYNCVSYLIDSLIDYLSATNKNQATR